jgi:hypothetical protein
MLLLPMVLPHLINEIQVQTVTGQSPDKKSGRQEQGWV